MFNRCESGKSVIIYNQLRIILFCNDLKIYTKHKQIKNKLQKQDCKNINHCNRLHIFYVLKISEANKFCFLAYLVGVLGGKRR